MARTPDQLTPDEHRFLQDLHLASLSTIRPDGSPHVTAMAFGFDPSDSMVRMITRAGAAKVRNIDNDGRVVVTQIEGARWLSLEGHAVVRRDKEGIAAAVAAYEARYRPAQDRPDRVGIEFEVTRVIGSA